MKKLLFPVLFLLLTCSRLQAQVGIYDSGGHLMPEQAAYDVTFYDLDLQVFPDEQTISGKAIVEARVVHPMNELVLDLDTTFSVIRALEGDLNCVVKRKGGKVCVELGRTRQRGERVRVTIFYDGAPRKAPRAPWDGGFSWDRTPSGEHWIATSCQTEGADLWWPNKDHVSDEPDSVALHIRVPEPLVVASNGRLRKKETHNDGTTTYHWFVSTPINNYNVALNIAPYRIIEGELESVAGEPFPVVFYVLPKDYEKGQELFPEILDHLRFFEKYLGPYPFRADKYGVAQTPHLGMEHQTIIAYGANFNNGSMTGGIDWGFDALHHHELAHEWWGNLVTNYDWKDMWIHEGFGSYMQALYMEELEGKEGYHRYMDNMRFSNRLAVAPLEVQSSEQIYRAPIYTKGAWVLHNLRYLLGDEVFFAALRKMAYPSKEMEQATDGAQCRFVTTEDFILICEDISGMQLDWFFDVFVRQPQLPELTSRVEGNTLQLDWDAPGNATFPMPVEVDLGDEIRRIMVPPNGITLKLKPGVKPVVDPDGWLLLKLKR